MFNGLQYETVDQIPVQPFLLQGTEYAMLEDAEAAAIKLFSNTTGVLVKRTRKGWTLMWWRRNA